MIAKAHRFQLSALLLLTVVVFAARPPARAQEPTSPEAVSPAVGDEVVFEVIGHLGDDDAPPVDTMTVRPGEYAWLAAEDYYGIRIVDIHDPRAPRQVAQHLNSWYYDLAIDGNTLHAVGDEWVHYRVFDVSNPLELAFSDIPETGSYGSVMDVALDGDYAYVTANSLHSFIALDKRNPRDVHRIWAIPISEPEWIQLRGDYAYVSNSDTLSIIYLGDRQSGRVVAVLPRLMYGEYLDIAFAGNYGYVTTGTEANEVARIYDLSNPAQPREVGTFAPPGGAFGVGVEGNQALFFNDQGVVVADISAPAAPRSLGLFTMPAVGRPERIGEYHYMTAGSGGFYILKFHPPVGPPPTYTVAGRVTDSCGRAVPAVEMTLDETRTALTDADGAYSFQEVERGTHTLQPFKVGFTFSPVRRDFTLNANWGGADFKGGIRWTQVESAVNTLATSGNDALGRVLGHAEDVAADGDYFRAQYDEHVSDAIANAIFNSAGLAAGGIKFVAQWEDGAKIALPGAKWLDWGHVIRLRNSSEDAARMFSDLVLRRPLPAGVPQMASDLLSGAQTYYAASFIDASLEEVVEQGADLVLATQLDKSQPLQDGFVPALARLTATYRADVGETAAATRQALPLLALEPEEAERYAEDLAKRAAANTRLVNETTRAADILRTARNARQAGESNWFAEFLGRFIGRSLAFFGGGPVGVFAFDLIDGIATLYADIQTINTDARFLAVATEGMAGALSVENRIYYNTVHGLDGLVACRTPATAKAEIVSIEHRSFGDYVLFESDWTWFEDESVTVLNARNTSGYNTVFQAAASYDVVGFLGLSRKQYFLQAIKSNIGVGTVPLQLIYKTPQDGASPEDGDTVEFDLFGTTDTGTYFILHDGFVWDPERMERSGRAAGADENAPTRPYPLRNGVAVLADELLYRPYFAVDNPFDVAISADLSQTLPDGATVIDAGGGTVAGGVIRWQRTLEPHTTVDLGYTAALSGAPGQPVTFAAPQLVVHAVGGDSEARFTGQATPLELAARLVAKGRPPRRVGLSQPLAAPFAVTNRAAGPSSGALTLTLYDGQSGAQLRQAERALTLPGNGAADVTLTLTTAGLARGDYLLVAELRAGSAADGVFATYVTIAPNTVHLPMIRR